MPDEISNSLVAVDVVPSLRARLIVQDLIMTKPGQLDTQWGLWYKGSTFCVPRQRSAGRHGVREIHGLKGIKGREASLGLCSARRDFGEDRVKIWVRISSGRHACGGSRML